jgi:protocatechuate 3,4-dioxygenase beta subunit
MVEFWLVGPDGAYSDAYRARVVAEETGHYTFESNRPVPYSGRPAHIHIRVTATGHRTLVTQHYPITGQQQATFDLVLRPQ